MATFAETVDRLTPDVATDEDPVLGLVRVFGLDLAPLTLEETLDQIETFVEAGEPNYVITANLNYAMLSCEDRRLAAINDEAALILADGMPLVWAAALNRTPLPGRTTGADLVPALCARAAERGYRVFLLGGLPEASNAAVGTLRQQLPGLKIVGTECPMIDRLSREETAQLVERIRSARPDILLAALGQPKGELWIAEHYRQLGVAACIQIGASLDFVAGRVRRAPVWIQRAGFEWLYRIYAEPRRLWRRYARNGLFLMRFAARRRRNLRGDRLRPADSPAPRRIRVSRRPEVAVSAPHSRQS
jgi:N-acetylglucosaminyldiphosphoundecaprenol N-acetyl-beta-D-mannosaminyltransferase